MDRRSLLALLATLPVLAGHAERALAASSAPRLRRIAASLSRRVEVTEWEAAGKRKGTILFSHGYGSSPRFYPDFVRAWTAAGYEVLAPLHVDSREYSAPGSISPGAIWAARIEDMRAVASLVEGPFVAAGHSFGALNALVLGGADAVVPEGIAAPLADERTRAVLAFSPPPPNPLLITRQGYGKLARPALIQSGTRDVPPKAGAEIPDWRSHMAAFFSGPPSGDRYGLVLEGTDHYFGGLICDPSKHGPDQHKTLELCTRASLAFLARFGPNGIDSPSHAPAFPIDPSARFYRR